MKVRPEHADSHAAAQASHAPRAPRARSRPAARGARLGAALALAGAATAALAAGPTPGAPDAALPPAAVTQALALARQAASALAPPGARVLASAGALDSRLRLAPCAQVQPYLAGGQPAWGRTRVGLRCQAGARWNVFLPVQVQVFAPALVSQVALPAGARLAEDQLETTEVDWSAAPSAPFTEARDAAGRVLARPVPAGRALHAADLQPQRWFASGQQVRIVTAGTGYSVSTSGQALSPGVEGQEVRVRTENGRVLVGRAVGENRVEVAL